MGIENPSFGLQMVKKRYLSGMDHICIFSLLEDDSDDGAGNSSNTSTNSKRQRFSGTVVSGESGNDDFAITQGKCSSCNTTGGLLYTCLKCNKLFHEQCDSFRVDRDALGICGGCLTSVVCEYEL